MKKKQIIPLGRTKNYWYIPTLLCSMFLFFYTQHVAAQCKSIIDVDFDGWSNGKYSISNIKSDFNDQIKPWTSSTYRGVSGPGAPSNLIENVPQETRIVNGTLRAEYLKNDASGRSGGFLFDSYFDGVNEAYLEYKVKFDDNFFWATGGKLPGLGGSTSGINSESTGRGAIPSGCKYNANGWSARLMWRRNRAQTSKPYLILYSYFAGKENSKLRKNGDCGDGKRIYTDLKDNKWYTIRQYIKMNTPGEKNGKVIMWINGEETYRDTKAMIRNSGKNSLKINALIMNTYRGGNRTDPVWHSPRTEYAFFDDFRVWTNCDDITAGNPTPANTNGPEGYTFATNEGGTVNVTGTVHIAYGADGKFNFKKNVSANTPCTNAAFGDPAKNTRKRCFIQKVNTPTVTISSCKFGTPRSSNLSSLNKIGFKKIYILGKNGPKASNFKEISINWNASRKKLYTFAINTRNGQPSYYVDLRSKITQNFGGSKPSIKISGSGIPRLDGDYWVTKDKGNFVMVSKNKGFTIYCSNNNSAPNCSGSAKASSQDKQLTITISPNPASDTITINSLSENVIQVDIYTINGQLVLLQKLNQDKNLKKLDVSSLTNGLYFAKVMENDGRSTISKFMITK